MTDRELASRLARAALVLRDAVRATNQVTGDATLGGRAADIHDRASDLADDLARLADALKRRRAA